MLNSLSLQLETEWFNQRLHDGGPIYTETNLDHFIVEPWNALSSLLIVLPAVYWLFQIRGQFRNYKFLVYSIPLMILGGTGSTLFHAFRASRLFLIMDILPTAILTLSLMIYFWLKVFKHWWYILFVIVASIGVRFLFFGRLPDFMAINISYIITGILIGIPLIIIQVKSKYYKMAHVLLAILFFILAILFREMDSWTFHLLPMGTHFLWHAFTGVGAYFILSYLYYFRKRELN
jgi:hemolysin III